MTTMAHYIKRTSPYGGEFRGECVLCGTQDLPMEAALEDCTNPQGLTMSEIFVDILNGKEPDKMTEEEIDTFSSDGLICPYCGYCREDDLQEIDGVYDGCGGEHTCGDCGKDFKFDTSITHYWTSYKIDVE